MDAKIIVHHQPVWRDRADYIIMAELDSELTNGISGREQLWSRRVGKLRFEICCIPFFVYNLALSDIVETDDEYIIRKVIEPSGHYTFRVWFGNSDDEHVIEDVIDFVKNAGGLYEWYSNNLLAIDAEAVSVAEDISSFLMDMEDRGLLVYETGKQ